MKQQQKSPKAPKAEFDLHLSTLRQALADVAVLHDQNVQFVGLPIEEWAGPGYAVGALFDPYVLAAGTLRRCSIVLDELDGQPPLPGLSVHESRRSLKERISFTAGGGRRAEYFLPALWGGVPYRRLEASPQWRPLATLAELPGALVRENTAVFAFNPLRVMHRYLNMAEPASTADFTDLLVQAILAAGATPRPLDDHDLRRDFHALGISTLLLCQLYRAAGRSWDAREIEAPLRQAAGKYVAGDLAAAGKLLADLFQTLHARRRQVIDIPIYTIVMPHGGILFESEGYAEYDWPDAAARVLNLLLDWAETCGAHFAPDIGAGTLEQFAVTHPATTARLRRAWDQGLIEFVDGTYGQPYMQEFPTWDQHKQFEVGLPVFERLFGRRPTVFASQEMALHPGLPPILARHGFRYAIHRAQNLGSAPVDDAPLVSWHAPGDSSPDHAIRSLPTHPLLSERRGGEIWRHLPILLTSSRNTGRPFIALTSLMDQTFIDIYNEEIVRSHRYAPLWGQFMTPTRFFQQTRSIDAPPRAYRIDDYHFELDLAGNLIHGHQTGGYSSEHAFLLAESRRLRALEQSGKPDPAAVRRLMEQEAHDCYIIPYFAPGYFMEGGLTDYAGPRYRASTDGPRGTHQFIRRAAGYPDTFRDEPPASAQPCTVDRAAGVLRHGRTSVTIDPASGTVVLLGDRPVSLGALRYNGEPLEVDSVAAGDCGLEIAASLPAFGAVRLGYFLSGGWLYATLDADRPVTAWDEKRITWADCVYLEHARDAQTEIIRAVGDIAEPTELALFHSVDSLTLRHPGRTPLHLRHGGNIFFRQTESAVQNRLWCYGEFCTRFWWAVQVAES